MIRTRLFTRWALACVASLSSFAVANFSGCAAEAEHPNIVMIIGDDHDYRDFGFMGSKVAQTPSLDRLAESGTVFNLAYATGSVCRPTLRTLLTGLHPLEYKLHEIQLGRDRRDAGEAGLLISALHTLPSRLADAGYASFQGGKYWEGSFGDAGFTDGMTEEGDVSRVRSQNRLMRQTMKPVADFVERHADQPFFLWFAPKLPHIPHNPPPQYLEPFVGKPLSKAARNYYASIAWFDAGVAELLTMLDAHELRERTLIVYLADNGWYPAPPSAPDQLGGAKGKLSLYETGFRTPIILNWPDHVPAGTRNDFISVEDLFPTLLDYAGAAPLTDRRGIDLRPFLESGEAVPRDALIGAMEGMRPNPHGTSGFFLRTRTWRYLVYGEGHQELYRIDRDPLEEVDLAGANPDVLRRMQKKVQNWMEELEEGGRERFRLASERSEKM